MLNLIFLLITFSFFHCNSLPLKPLSSIKPLARIKPELPPTQSSLPQQTDQAVTTTPLVLGSPKPEVMPAGQSVVLPTPGPTIISEQQSATQAPSLSTSQPTITPNTQAQTTSALAEILPMRTPDFKIESVFVSEDLLEKSNTSGDKLAEILEKANSQNKEISDQYKKSDIDATASIDQIDKKLGEFNQLYRDIKSYLASQKSGSDKEVDEKVRLLEISTQEFSQDYNNLKALRKEVETAQKDLVLQNSDKTSAIFKIYGFQNSLDSIKSDFLKLEAETPDKITQSLKQMDEFCQDAEKQLTILQTIGSSFKGKVDILSGKINQATESLKTLMPKKEELTKKLKSILDLKEKGATIREAELLGKIESSGINKKRKKSSKMPEIILNKKPTSVDDNLEYVAIDEKAITISFIQKISAGFFGFAEKLLKFTKKLFGAIVLNKRNTESKLTIETKSNSQQSSPAIIPATLPVMPTQTNTQPTTPIIAPLPTAALVPAMSLSLTTTPTTISPDKVETKKAEEVDFFKILIEAFGHIILGLKKIALLLYHYISEVYRNLASTQP